MPWSSASRGEPSFTGWPSTSSSPSSCWLTRVMILISVDFPAPLYPRTQVTSPLPTLRLIPSRRVMFPVGLAHVLELDQRYAGRDLLERGFCDVLGHVRHLLVISGSPGADPEIGHGGPQQHHAEEGLQPVRVPAGVDDALVDHAVDEGADSGADRGAVAAGQQAAADHGRDDVDELVADTLTGLHGVERNSSCMPTNQARKPTAMNSPILVFATGTPTARALSASPPTA